MKKRLCVLMSILLLASMFPVESFAQKGGGGQNITSTVNTARYIMFGGTYTIGGAALQNGSKTGDQVISAVFKLDTYTGRTWMLEVDKAGAGRPQWVPVEDADVSAASEKESPKNENLGNQKSTLKSLKTLDE
ncbi:MAG TPA: hypothetical protein DET40_23520 [Lentisphaeria bacterium]|nr:MAG: hypothetical protein A2X45_23735 [Lentisphaerae bacterium GWF2_50_93]HCE46526.1 hypothetical protein [Lentisphaeria bacterium]